MTDIPHDRRDRDMPIGDTSRILAIIYTLGFFAIVLTLMLRGIPSENKDAMNLLLGMLGLIQAGIVKFYFDGTQAAETAIKAGVAGRAKADEAIQEIAKAVPTLPPAPAVPTLVDNVNVAAETVNVTDAQAKQ